MRPPKAYICLCLVVGFVLIFMFLPVLTREGFVKFFQGMWVPMDCHIPR